MKKLKLGRKEHLRMSIWCLGIYKKSLKGSTVGYLIGDTETVTETKGTDGKVVKQIATKVVSTENLILGMKKGTKVENMELTATGVRINSGSENAYPAYEPGTNKFLGIGDRGVKACQVYGVVKLPFVVVARDEKIGMHRCVMASGRIGDYSDAAIIKDVEQGGRVLSNATVVNDNGKKFIRLKKGEVEQVEKAKEVMNNKVTPVAPAPKPVVQQVTPQKPTVTQTPVGQKQTTPSAAPKLGLEQFLEIKESSTFGPYIAKVKIPDKETLDKIIGEQGRVKGPLAINGKIVKCIDVCAFMHRDASSSDIYDYSSAGVNNEDMYAQQVVNRFDFSMSGNMGFTVVDASGMFNSRPIDNTICLSINLKDVYDWDGTLLTPHYTANKEVPNAIGGEICPPSCQLCVLDNIKTLYTCKTYRYKGIDLRRSGVTFIPKSFMEDKQLYWILLNNRIERIHEKAFYRCNGLRRITITAGVREIAEKAFFQCIDLREVDAVQNAEVKRISESAFAYCSKLTMFNFSMIKGTLSTKVFDNTKLSTELTIPGTITKIGAACFRETEIRNITFEEGVEELGGELLSISVTKRGKRLYINGFKHVEMYIPKSVKTVGKLQELDGMRYTAHIEHGCASENFWKVEQSRLKQTKLKIVYEGEALSADENSFASMLSIMGKEGLINSLTQMKGGNDTPYSLQDLLAM